MSKNRFHLGSSKPEVVRALHQQEMGERFFIEEKWKQRKEIIDYLLLKASLAVCDWMSLSFNFVALIHS